jgi:hypothetical protein
MKRYFKYGNNGGIDKVKRREINCNSGYFNSLKALLDSCITKYAKNYKIEYYGYDDRIKRDVYMVVADHSGYKQQFMSYFIED